MSNDETNTTNPASVPRRTDAEALQAVVRLLRLIRYRKRYLAGAVVVACLLGGLYYLTATRIYEAKASLLVTQSGSNILNAGAAPDRPGNSFIPTYEHLFEKAVVLDDAVRTIQKLPADLKVDFRSYPLEEWIEVLRTNMSVRSTRNTKLIELCYRSQSPDAAEAIVRAVVDAYMDFVEKYHKNVSVEIAALLEGERNQIEQQLAAKQQELLTVQHRVRDLGLREGSHVSHPIVQRVVQLNETLVTVQKDRLQLKATLTALQTAVRNGDDVRHHLAAIEPTVARELLMGTLGLNPQGFYGVGLVERKLTEDRAKLQSWQQHLGPQHPEFVRLAQSVQNAEAFLANHHRDVQQRLQQAYDRELAPMMLSMVQRKLAEAESHERELLAQYAVAENEAVRMNDRLAELQIVENELERLRRLHDVMLDRISNVDINQNHADVRVAVVNEPRAVDRPVSPRLAWIGAFCLFCGLGGGVALAYILDLLDDRFRSPEEMQDQLGVPVLAMVRKLGSMQGTGADAIQVHVDPAAVDSEAFRTLRTALALSADETQRLAVTSTQPSDGKTTVLANLAVACAQAGKRTLAIDADLRKPGLSKLFDFRALGGLSDVLRSDEPIETACRQRIQSSGVANLDVLPCGPRPSNPAELLSHRRLSEVIAWAEAHYDQVLIDCPPMLAASDAAIVGRLVDGVLMVVRPNENHRRAVIRAIEGLTTVHVRPIGIVANHIARERDGGLYGYASGYGYGYGAGYGYRDDDEGDDESDATGDEQTQYIAPRRAA